MSFILDALKKSEDERQRTVGPSLADAPLRRNRIERPWWAVAVAALLVINLGVLIVVLLRDKPTAASASHAVSTVAAQSESSLPATATMAPPESVSQPAMVPAQPVPAAPGVYRQPANPTVRSLAEEAGAQPPVGVANIDPQMNAALAAAAAAPPGPAMVRPIQPPNVTPLPGGVTFPSGTGTAPVQEEVLPTAGALAAGGTSLPELKLDIHVYSKNPAERFVFVNMRKYLEGQTLQEGPVLEKITYDGVVLNRQGLRFSLPRQ